MCPSCTETHTRGLYFYFFVLLGFPCSGGGSWCRVPLTTLDQADLFVLPWCCCMQLFFFLYLFVCLYWFSVKRYAGVVAKLRTVFIIYKLQLNVNRNYADQHWLVLLPLFSSALEAASYSVRRGTWQPHLFQAFSLHHSWTGIFCLQVYSLWQAAQRWGIKGAPNSLCQMKRVFPNLTQSNLGQ